MWIYVQGIDDHGNVIAIVFDLNDPERLNESIHVHSY